MVKGRVWILVVGVLLLVATTVWAQAAEVRLRAVLKGDEIGGIVPGGNADFRDDGSRQRLSVEIEDVNCPGVRLRVVVAGERVGTIRVNQFNRGDLNLDTDNGDTVPPVVAGDRAVVRDNLNGDCTGTPRKVVLSGQFKP